MAKRKLGCSFRAARLIKTLEQASNDMSWSGSYPPSAHNEILLEYKQARAALERYIGDLESRDGERIKMKGPKSV